MSPFKVLVVDDKPLIARAIVETIDWGELECTVIDQAADGLAGMEAIKKGEPDLLITDIKMPGLSGLELAEYMQNELPMSKTILITGFEEFEFAKKAVRLGVHDFIVKPVKKSEMTQTIRNAVNELKQRREEQHSGRELKQQYSKLAEDQKNNLKTLQAKLITDVISGSPLSEDELLSAQQSLGLKYNRLAVIVVKPKQGLMNQAPAGDVLAQLATRLREISRNYEFQLIETYYNQELVLGCLFPKSLSIREGRLKLQAFSLQWLNSVEGTELSSCRLTASSLYKSVSDLRTAYQEAKGLLDTGFFRNDGGILIAQPDESGKERVKSPIVRDLEKFAQDLGKSSDAQLRQDLDQLLGNIANYSEGNILVAKGFLCEMCFSAVRSYVNATGDEMGLDRTLDQMLKDIFQLDTMEEAGRYMHELMADIRKRLNQEDKAYSLTARKVLSYIQQHYAEPISLTSIAEIFDLHPGYLSRLLRTETGINFVDLVSTTRIRAAKRLLEDPKHKVNEVGELVGYKEYAYFYQVFKRLEGMSPKQYRAQVARSFGESTT